METAVRLIGIVPLALLAAGVLGWALMTRGQKRVDRGGFGKGALELASSVSEIERRVGDLGDPRRERARKLLELDGLFVVAYWVLLIALGVLLAVRDEDTTWTSWPLWVGAAAIVTATIAAFADATENARLRRVLDQALSKTRPREVRAVRSASLVKWATFTGTLALLSALFSGGDRTAIVGAFWSALLILAWLGFVGLLWHPALTATFIGTALVTLAVLVYFAGDPGGFLEGYRLD